MHYKDVNSVDSREQISKTIKKFGSLGLQVHITEMTISCKSCEWDQEALKQQARGYRNALAACLDNPGVCTAFLTWGFTDARSHYGEDDFPLLFTKAYKKKKAYRAMMKLLLKD